MKNKRLVNGISHITLICKDLGKTTCMLTELFSAKEIYYSGDKTFSISKEKFFDVAGIWICTMEVSDKNYAALEKTYNHIAFQVENKSLPLLKRKIKKLGLKLRPSRKRKNAEGSSLYFYDYDNHLFELHSGNLKTRLKLYNSK